MLNVFKQNMANEEKVNQNNKKSLVQTIFNYGCLFFAFVSVLSGLFVLITRPIAPHLFNQIIITSDDYKEVVDFDKPLLPGDSKDYELKIESKLAETVKYDIKFEDFDSKEIGKYFYISASIGDEVLINNTLDQVFEFTPIIRDRVLESYATNVVKFTFSINRLVDFYYDISFSIVIEAKGRLIN